MTSVSFIEPRNRASCERFLQLLQRAPRGDDLPGVHDVRFRGSMKLTDVIRRPLVTEKTSILREDGRTIVFQVSVDANKVEIKRAIEQLLGTKVDSIRTAIAHGKVKRQGR